MTARVTRRQGVWAFPYAAICVLFVVVPLLLMFGLSFTVTENRVMRFSFDNYIYMFTYSEVWTTMARSVLVAALTTIICFFLAYPLALMLANSKISRNATLVLLFVAPMLINSLLRIYALQTVFGILNISKGFWPMTIGMVYDFFPFMLLPLYTTVSNIDKSYTEASGDLGATPVTTFFRVILPLSVPGIISGFLMVFMPTISTFAVSAMLGGANNYMFGNLIETLFTYNNEPRGSAYAVIMLILILVTMVVANAVRGRSVGGTGNARRAKA